MAPYRTYSRKPVADFPADPGEAPAEVLPAPPPAPDAPPSFLEKPEPAAVEPDPLERSGLQLYLQEIAKTPLLTIAEEVHARRGASAGATRRRATT